MVELDRIGSDLFRLKRPPVELRNINVDLHVSHVTTPPHPAPDTCSFSACFHSSSSSIPHKKLFFFHADVPPAVWRCRRWGFDSKWRRGRLLLVLNCPKHVLFDLIFHAAEAFSYRDTLQIRVIISAWWMGRARASDSGMYTRHGGAKRKGESMCIWLTWTCRWVCVCVCLYAYSNKALISTSVSPTWAEHEIFSIAVITSADLCVYVYISCIHNHMGIRCPHKV